MTRAKKAEKEPSFEESLELLNGYAHALEQEMPLDEALQTYEKAVALCQKLRLMLDTAEKKVMILTNGEAKEDETMV